MGGEQENIVEYLMKAGADINHKDREGNTALSLAKEQESNEIVAILKSAGSQPSIWQRIKRLFC